jgi:hypothetical protein
MEDSKASRMVASRVGNWAATMVAKKDRPMVEN